MSSKIKISFLVPYPHGQAPSQRFRFEQYLLFLKNEGLSLQVLSFYSLSLWKKMYLSGGKLGKVFGVLYSLLKRWVHFLKVLSSDFVFIHREIMPLGPPVLEFLLAKVFKKKVIYDFDDAIWLTDEKGRVGNFLRCFWKVKYICKWSYKVSCGNEFLASYARKWNKNVIINPTTIDTDYHSPGIKLNPNKTQEEILKGSNEKKGVLPIIGWTGSHSTLKYLNNLLPVFKELEDKFELLVICNKNPEFDLKHFRFVQWSKSAEVNSLREIDFGVMPLPDDKWTKGKCGFKALQYMALAKPAIVSPVGVNEMIVKNGENGFLARSNEDWKSKIELLLHNREQRKLFGENGRSEVEKNYSVHSNQSLFLSLFE